MWRDASTGRCRSVRATTPPPVSRGSVCTPGSVTTGGNDTSQKGEIES